MSPLQHPGVAAPVAEQNPCLFAETLFMAQEAR